MSQIKSANWHITSNCNYACKFCFAKNRGSEILDIRTITGILTTLREKGIEKINFAGGEPLLHPRLKDMLSISKGLEMVTSVVTNGSLLSDRVFDEMSENIDWIGISIDSANDEIERSLGRGSGHHVEYVKTLAPIIHSKDIKLKINTVVIRTNLDEDLRPLIEELDPQRWKVFQYLHVDGTNDENHTQMQVSTDEFRRFETRNRNILLRGGSKPIFESNEDMVRSYLMISPDGQLTINSDNSYTKVSWDHFRREPMEKFIDEQRYLSRGGLYHWL